MVERFAKRGASLVNGLHDASGAKQSCAEQQQQQGLCVQDGAVPTEDFCQSADKGSQAEEREEALHRCGPGESSESSTTGRRSLDAVWLRTALAYNPCTGALHWLRDLGSRASAGQAAGYVSPDGYLTVRLNGRLYQAHRVIWLWMTGSWPGGPIDHRDQNRLNNAWSNLRVATPRMNVENIIKARADSTHGLRGVYRDKRKGTERFGARIRTHGKSFALGTYASREKAHEAYVAAKLLLHAGWCPPAGVSLGVALRAALPGAGGRPARADSKTGVPGVARHGARFRARYKGRHLGVYESPEEAAEAVRRARGGV